MLIFLEKWPGPTCLRWINWTNKFSVSQLLLAGRWLEGKNKLALSPQRRLARCKAAPVCHLMYRTKGGVVFVLMFFPQFPLVNLKMYPVIVYISYGYVFCSRLHNYMIAISEQTTLSNSHSRGRILFSGGKFTEVLLRRADRRGDLFQDKLPETKTTTTQ